MLVGVVGVVVISDVRALVCTGEMTDTFVEVLTVDTRVDVIIVVSNVAVDLLMDVLTDAILGVLANIEIDVLVDGNANVFVDVMTIFEFAMPGPLE